VSVSSSTDLRYLLNIVPKTRIIAMFVIVNTEKKFHLKFAGKPINESVATLFTEVSLKGFEH